MGFMEYLKKLMDQKVNTTNLMTGEPDKRTVGQRLRAGGEWIPGPSDAISAYDTYDAIKKGNFKDAALNAIGVLPGIPAMAGVIRKSSESMVPEYAYHNTDNIDPNWTPETREQELAINALDTMHKKWAKNAGSELDPFYKLMEEGIINDSNFDDLIGRRSGQLMTRDNWDFINRLDEIGGYGGQYDYPPPGWQKVLRDHRENMGLPVPTGDATSKRLQNTYDRELLSEIPNEWDEYNAEDFRFFGKENFAEQGLDQHLSPKEKAFFDKLGDFDMIGANLDKYDYPIFGITGEDALIHALKKGTITPSSLVDNRIGLPGLIDFIGKHKRDIKEEGARVPPEDILNTFDSGHQWMELKKPEQLKLEGDKMSNCVGGYCDKVEKGDSRIFSLRNAEGTSKVTVEWDPRSRSFPQIFGPGNSAPKEKYRDMIDWLIGKSIDW